MLCFFYSQKIKHFWPQSSTSIKLNQSVRKI